MSSIAEQLLEKCRSKPQQEDDHRRVGDDASGAVELDAPLSLCEVEHSISVVERRSQDVQVGLKGGKG